jgi:hypothetical protein
MDMVPAMTSVIRNAESSQYPGISKGFSPGESQVKPEEITFGFNKSSIRFSAEHPESCLFDSPDDISRS